MNSGSLNPNLANEPVTVAELISFYTDVIGSISTSDKNLVLAFRDTSNLTVEQRYAYSQWLDARNSYLEDIIELAMAKHITGAQIRN